MKQFEESNISLVTGGAGFIGSHVAEELLKLGHRVVVLDDLSGGFRTNVPAGAEFIRGTILDSKLLRELFKKYRFTYVYHLAAYAAEGLSHFIKRFNYNNNLIGSVNLINESVNAGTVRCFVFTSSIAVYGHNQLPMKEEMMPIPEDPYGIAKLAVELDLKEAKNMFGLNYVIFRPHNVYGERQNIGDPYRNVVGIFMNQILQGKPMTIFGDGNQSRAFTYIKDIAPIIAIAGMKESAWNQIYNVGSDKTLTVKKLAEMVANVMGITPSIKYLAARKEVQHAYSSHEKIKKYFPEFSRETIMEEGLKNMAEWVMKHGAKTGKAFKGIEVVKNMPETWKKLIK